MRRTFKYRANINRQTAQNVERWLELCRQLYNAALEQRIDAYQRRDKSLSYYDQSAELPGLKVEFPEFKQVDAQCFRETLKRIDKAYKAFFRRVKGGAKPGFPRFKAKNRYHSFTLQQHSWRLDGRYLHIRNVGRFKLFLSRPVEGDIKTVTVKRSATGKWFVTFSCDNVPAKPLPATGRSVGIDMGVKAFATDSDGGRVLPPCFFVQSEKELATKNRTLHRRKIGSNRRNKARLAVALCHERIVNRRRDFTCKLALDYIRRYDLIAVEDLAVADMIENYRTRKDIWDAAWSSFFAALSCKAEEADKTVVKVDSSNTSRTCSNCGHVRKSVGKHFICPICGTRLDRDYNAARNILRAGQARQGAETLVSAVN